MQVSSVVFVVKPVPDAGSVVKVKATGYAGANIAATNAVLGGEGVKASNLVAVAPFADKIDYVKKMSLGWQISLDGGEKWLSAGTSLNTLYVTWADPVAISNIETLFKVGCEAAKGVTGVVGTADDVLVLDRIWAKFQYKRILRASDDFVLTYYGFYDTNTNGVWDARDDIDHNSTTNLFVTLASDLISTGNGQCHSWAQFMSETLKAQGLASVNGNENKIIGVEPRKEEMPVPAIPIVGFAVRNWDRVPGFYFWDVVLDDAGVDGSHTKILNPLFNEACDIRGVAGQGNSPNPPSMFGNHYIIFVNEHTFVTFLT